MFVSGQDQLRIRLSTELVALRSQFNAQLFTVIKPAVHRQIAQSIIASQGLSFALRFWNGLQQEVAKADRPAYPLPDAIWSTMSDGVAHSSEQRGIHRPFVKVVYACYAAHL